MKRPLSVFKVEGKSMSPLLSQGDYVITSSWRAVKAGRIVVVKHHRYGIMVKRVKSVLDSKFMLEGIHSDSTSTEDMGWFSADQLLGVMIFHVERRIRQ